MQIKNVMLGIAVLSLTACTTPIRMSADDLSVYKTNCAQRQQQWNFLESQKSTEQDRIKNVFQMTSVFGQLSNWWNGTYRDSQDMLDQRHEAMIKAKQRELRQKCLLEDFINQQK
jgi:hypothetical protein